MVNIILMRHGESEANVAGIHGQPTTFLTDRGREQAKESALQLKGIRFDNIYTSTNLRAIQTGEYFGKITATHEGFVERSFGVLESEPGQVQLNKFKPLLDSLPKVARAGIRYVADMESDLDAYMRFSSALREVVTPDSNLLIVTHRNVMRVFLDYAEIVPLRQGSIKNCGYVKLELDEKTWQFKLVDARGVQMP